MNYHLVIILSLSIIPAALAGLIRCQRVSAVWFPFIVLTGLAALNEILSFCMYLMHISNSINNNVYLLLEMILIIWQFKNWKLFSGNQGWIAFLISSLIALIWFSENFKFSSLTRVDLTFRIFSSLTVALMSITLMTRNIFSYDKPLYKNPVFLITAAYIVYFTYKILLEIFLFFTPLIHKKFLVGIFDIYSWINFLANCTFFIAILWIPRKPQYITL